MCQRARHQSGVNLAVIFVALDRPFDDGRVQTANVAVNASTVSANTMDDLIFMFMSKTNFIYPRLQTRRDSRDGCF